MFLTENLLKDAPFLRDDRQIHDSAKRPIEDVLGVGFLVESVHGDDDACALEAFEARHSAVEGVFGEPPVVLVGVAIGVTSLDVDGVPTRGSAECQQLEGPNLTPSA